MFINENRWRDALPLYDVKELSLEEALLVLAAEKELLRAAPPATLASKGGCGQVADRSRAVA